ncbi:MAG: hypothetical protein ABII07_00445 [Patescibacteria group bacterium]|nr:hypothetical protein [Patescibacteria group bacterium]
MPIRHFPGQAEGENIEFLVRKHWIIDVKVSIITLAAFVIPVLIFFSAVVAYWPGFFNNSRGIITIFFLLYLLFAQLIIYIKWLNEELDLIIVTNRRVINLDQVKFMERTVSETNLSQVQDVKGIAKGIMSNMLEYGDLEIQTAAEKIMFRIENVPHPFETARKIMHLRDKSMEKFGNNNQI